MSEMQASDKAGHSPYRVLARKYRPQSFDDLIGQEPMVRTLTNAFETGRIAQAYLLTGVRGVGKTSTARILARALNYQKPGGPDRPSIDFSEPGEHCAAIMEGRHIDVIEMDAASHTGINDVREIIEAVRYKPAVARYKVYIIDEVHMLSNQAFNGLLKTLEEPPEHVKFIFATTEVRKVPVTILSRCQRFDLRRIEASRLVTMLGDIAAKENVSIDHDALAMIARAAEGSARDALSLLDQAIAHSAAGKGGERAVAVDDIRAMLGLADRNRVIDLFDQLMRGDAAAALATLGELFDSGADPAQVLEDLANFNHIVMRLKITPDAANDASFTEEERDRGRELAEALSVRVLSRSWQILVKGIDESREASRPLAAAEMVLVRLAYAADLPTPDEAIRQLADRNSGKTAAQPVAATARPAATTPSAAVNAGSPPPVSRGRAGPVAAASAPAEAFAEAESPQAKAAGNANRPKLDRFEDLVRLAGEKRDLQLKYGLERFVRLTRFETGRIELGLTDDAPTTFTGDLGNRLREWTGERWIVTIDREAAAPTLFEKQANERAQLVDGARRNPTVAAVLARFPGAEIVDIRVGKVEPGQSDGLADPSLEGDPSEQSGE
jgi:DNA polymerase-3 subunit gamma/tau